MAKYSKDSELLWADSLSDEAFDEMTKDFDWQGLASYISIVLQKEHEDIQPGLVMALGDVSERQDRGVVLK